MKTNWRFVAAKVASLTGCWVCIAAGKPECAIILCVLYWITDGIDDHFNSESTGDE